MDPLSVTSAAAMLLGLSIQATGALSAKWDDQSRPSVDRLRYEISRIRAILEAVEIESSSIDGPIILFDDLPTLFDNTRRILVPFVSQFAKSTSESGSTQRILQWETYDPFRTGHRLPLSKGEVENVVRNLQLCHSKLLTSLSHIPQLGLHNMSNAFSKPETRRANDVWNRKAEYVNAHAKAQEEYLEETGTWLLGHDQFQKWIRSDRSNNTIYCPGPPGSGKTVLTSKVIEEVKKRRFQNASSNIGVAYFYFSYRMVTPILSVVLALMEQLYLQANTVPSEVGELESGSDASEITLNNALSVLMALAGRFRRCYFILDALDECANEFHTDLTDLLTAIVNSSCHLFVASRPSLDFAVLKEAVNIPFQSAAEDIERYARYKISHDSTLRKQVGKHVEEVVTKLVESSQSIFLMVALRLDALRQSTDVLLDVDAMTKTPWQIYKSTIDRIHSSNPELREVATSVLTWLFYCTRPMGTQELEDVLSWRSGHRFDIATILQASMGLVNRSEAGDTVSFMHFSVYEYLRERVSLKSHEPPPLGEDWIASECLEYLVETSDRIDLDVLSVHPFYIYATSSWGIHLHRQGVPTPRLRDLALKFLECTRAVSTAVRTMDDTRASDTKVDDVIIWPESNALHLAAYFGLTWALGTLLKQHSIDSGDEFHQTALHIASRRGHVDFVKALLDGGANPRAVDIRGKNVWHHFGSRGDQSLGTLLMTVDTQNAAARDGSGKTPLDYAASRGDESSVSLLLGASDVYLEVDGPGSRLDAALFHAVEGGSIKTVERILEAGAIPDTSHLLRAVRLGFVPAVNVLLEYGVDINDSTDTDGYPIHMALAAGNHAVLRAIIWDGADLEVTDEKGRTALAFAVAKGDVTAVAALLKGGANANAVIEDGLNALIYGAVHGMQPLVRLLLEAGANIESKDASGNTALAFAVRNDHADVVRLLLEQGAIDVHLNSTDKRAISKMLTDAEANNDLDHTNNETLETTPLETISLSQNVKQDSDNGQQDDASILSREMSDSGHDKQLMSPPTDPSQQEEHSSSEHEKNIKALQVARPASKSIKDRALTKRASSYSIERPRSTSKSHDVGTPLAPAKSYILLQHPLPPQALRLGTIVADPLNPLFYYLPKTADVLEEATAGLVYSSQTNDYQALQSHDTKSGLRALLTNTAATSKKTMIQAPKVVHTGLTNHTEVFQRLVHTNAAELFEMLSRKQRSYMVVGLLILHDAEIAQQSRRVKETSVSIGIDLPSLGVPVSVGASMSGSNQHAEEEIRARYEGEVVYAVQYRKVVLSRKSYLRAKKESDLALGEYAKSDGNQMAMY